MATNGVVMSADRIEPAASSGQPYFRPMARAARLGTVPRAFPTTPASNPATKAMPITGKSLGFMSRHERRMPRMGPSSSITMAGATATKRAMKIRPGRMQNRVPMPSRRCTKNQAARRAQVRRPVARRAEPTVSSPPR